MPGAATSEGDVAKTVAKVGVLAALPLLLLALLAGVALFVLVIFIVLPFIGIFTTSAENRRERERIATTRAEVVSLDELLSAAADEDRWESKGYEGRVIQITGRVESFQREKYGVTIWVEAAQKTDAKLLCHIEPLDASPMLSAGDGVTVRGSAKWSVNSVVLEECSFVR